MATVFYRPQALETIARRTLSEYDIMYLNGSPRAVPIETIIEKTFGLRIEYQYLTNDARELGRMIYDSGITTYYNRDIMDYALMRVEGGTMLIEAALLEDEKSYGRLRFTLAHELAHYIIHKQVFSGTGVAAALYNNDTDEDATEWQANYLAKAILMPNGQIKRCFYLLVIAMLCVLCFPVQVMAETQQGTNGDELQLMEAQKLEIQLGAEWAGVEFQLKTDAGLYPGTIVVGQDGVLRTEIGGSSTYILTCLNSAVEVPEPTQDSATTEKPDTENQSGTEEAEEDKATVAGIPVLHIVLFGGGMVVAVGALIAMHVVKKRRESDSAYDDDEDE